VIDSKVSLVAYERMANAETEEERNWLERRNHVASLRNHIKLLSAKNYQQLHGVKSLDFVLLFIPIEPAFAAAVQAEPGLFQEAFDRNIVLVSPTTLLATLRTVSTLWRQEYQNRNAIEIAKKGGALYDKFVSFAEDLVKLGNQMDTSRKTYDEVMKKLSNGTGNLVRRAEEMRKLGVQTTKTLNAALKPHDEDEE
jgi:DNA recombination protein RmuC